MDEVGEMPTETQIKLLRVLEDRKISRVGANEQISVNVRLVAATNANLVEAVDKGTFRKDLYYRLNVVNINLPPLRERRQDIPVPHQNFLKDIATQHGKHVEGMSKGARQAFMAYDSGSLSLQSMITLRLRGVVPPEGYEVPEDWQPGDALSLQTTLGRALFNEALPADYEFVNEDIDKKRLGALVNDLAERYTKTKVANTLDEIKDRKPGDFLQGPDTDPAAVAKLHDAVRSGTACRKSSRTAPCTPWASRYHGAGGVVGSDVITFGGRSAPADLTSGTTTLQVHPLPRCSSHAPTATTVATTPPTGIGVWGQAHSVGSGGLYVFGGSNQNADGCSSVAAVFDWDSGTQSGSWTQLANMPVALCQAVAATVTDTVTGRELIMVTGGVRPRPRPATSGATPTVNSGTLVYDVQANTWSTSLEGINRFNASAASEGTQAFFVGGSDTPASNTSTPSTFVGTIANGVPTFTQTADISANRSLAGVVVRGGLVYVVGGSTSTAANPAGTTLVLRAPSDLSAWTALQTSDNGVVGAITVLANFDEPTHTDLERILLVLGSRNSTNMATVYQEYNP